MLLPVGMGLGALVTAMRYWHNSAGSFSTVARATGGQAVARASGQAGMGLSGLGSGGLVLGHVGGQLIALLTLIRAGLPKNSRGRTLEVARRYRRFPMLSAPGSLLTSVGLHGPPVVYAAYFGLVVSGLYGFAMAVLGLPTALLSQSISQVFYPTAARQEADPVQARRLIDQVTGVLLSIAIPVFGTLAVSGPWLFTAIFGSGWEAAGRYAQLLAPWLAVRFVVSPVSTYLFVVEQQDVALRISVIEAALRVAAVAIGIATASPELAIGLYSLASLGALIEWLRRVLLEVQSSVHQWMQQRAQPLIGTALVIVSGILLSRTSDVVGLLATVVSLTAIGLWIVWPYRQDLTGAASPGNVDGPSAP